MIGKKLQPHEKITAHSGWCSRISTKVNSGKVNLIEVQSSSHHASLNALAMYVEPSDEMREKPSLVMQQQRAEAARKRGSEKKKWDSFSYFFSGVEAEGKRDIPSPKHPRKEEANTPSPTPTLENLISSKISKEEFEKLAHGFQLGSSAVFEALRKSLFQGTN